MTRDWEPSGRYDEWPTCRSCAHWQGNRCIAYPKAIPFRIVSGQTDHMVPRPGQVGETVFEPMDLEHWRLTGERRSRRYAQEHATAVAASDGAQE